jgi:hypothetical protein
MRYSFKHSYTRSVEKLDRNRAEKVHCAFEQLMHLFETGEKTPGLGLKPLRFNLWEVRAGLIDRIVFRREKDSVEFIAAGTHDEIRKLLKNY